MLRKEKHIEANYSGVYPKGEKNAFDFFFRQYYTSLCFFANSILHDEDEAKDIVQDCFIKLWDGHTITERSETVKTFLYTIVRNKCLDLLRKRRVIKKAELQIIKNSATEFEYFDEAAFAEMIRQIFQHIDHLPSRMQQVIKLHYLEGKNYKEIASNLNTSSETVRNQKGKALKMIRKKLLLLLTMVIQYL